jgi:ribonuclease P protein component
VLATENRMRRRAQFECAVRSGRRAGRRTVVVHLGEADGGVPKVGFVVSRSVGSATIRNRVKRRLRHVLREHVSAMPEGSLLVVRANPASATASSAELRREVAWAVARLMRARGEGS